MYKKRNQLNGVVYKHVGKRRHLPERFSSTAYLRTIWLILSNGEIWHTVANRGYVKWDGIRQLPKRVRAAWGAALWNIEPVKCEVCSAPININNVQQEN